MAMKSYSANFAEKLRKLYKKIINPQERKPKIGWWWRNISKDFAPLESVNCYILHHIDVGVVRGLDGN